MSVNYSSRGGNGVLGVGFSLSAGSSIHRCGSTLAQDGITKGIQFTSSDKLCLDGQRLMLVSGTYGVSGAVYRTELDSMVRVSQSGNINGGTTSFTAKYSSGRKVIYGGNAFEVNPVGVTPTMSWLVKVEYDASLNNVRYAYQTYGDGETLVKNIYYTGHNTSQGDRRVEFIYANRADNSSSYISGGRTEQTKVLDSIKTYVAGSAGFYYNFDYTASQASSRSLLRDVTQCRSGGSCLSPTTFNWEDREITYVTERMGFGNSTASTSVRHIKDFTPHGDFNGDGTRDWPNRYVNAESKVVNDSQFRQPMTCNTNPYTGQQTCADGDFNQDGRTDGWYKSSGKVKLQITRKNLAPQVISTNIPLSHAKDEVKFVADVNGDSWPDIAVYYYNNGYPQMKLYLHSKNISAPFNAAGKLVHDYSSRSAEIGREPTEDVQLLGDMNGDGLPDFVVSKTYDGMRKASVSPIPKKILQTRVSGSSVVFDDVNIFDDILGAHYLVSEGVFTYFIDVNGDGLSDWLGWRVEEARLKLSLNKGNGSFEAPKDLGINLTSFVYSTKGPIEPWANYVVRFKDSFRVMDINGDGKNELLMPDSSRLAATGCATYRDAGTQKTKCGASMYTKFEPQTDPAKKGNEQPVATHDWDDSVYYYRALTFNEDLNGNYSVAYENTNLMASATQNVVVDAYGKGLQDIVFTYGVRYSGNSYIKNPISKLGTNYGVWITRNCGVLTASQCAKKSDGTRDYKPHDMLASVTNGVGHKVRWAYRPLTSGIPDKLYEKDEPYFSGISDGDERHMHFASSMYVVSDIYQDNGVGGENRTSYQYRNAVLNTQGRGFQGFATIITKDHASGITNMTEFDQVFPRAGKAIVNRQYLTSDFNEANPTANWFTETKTNWAINSAHDVANNSGATSYTMVNRGTGATVKVYNANQNALYHVYPSSTVTKTKSIDTTLSSQSVGALLATSTTTIASGDIDKWGNVLKSVSTVTDENWGTAVTQTVTTYAPDSSGTWWPGKWIKKAVTKKAITGRNGVDPYVSGLDRDHTVTTHIDQWNTTHRQPYIMRQVGSYQISGGAGLTTTTTTTYATSGLPKSVAVKGHKSKSGSAWVNETRTTTMTYTKNGSGTDTNYGYFPLSVTNALGHKVTSTYNTLFGQPKVVTNANGVKVTTTYDDFGQPLSVDNIMQPVAYSTLQAKDSDAPSYAVAMQVTAQAGTPKSKTYIDKLGRPLRQAVQNFDGSWIFTDKVYNSRGLVDYETAPYIEGQSKYKTEYSLYDALGRYRQKDVPQVAADLTIHYTQYGDETTVSAGSMPDQKRTYNIWQQLVETIDGDGGIVRYSYDALGNPIVIRDPNGHKIKAWHNSFGHKYKVDDPNQGVTNFVYNGFGELLSQTDARGKVITYTLDKLGRTTTRVADGLTATYVWDTLKKGLLSYEQEGSMKREYTYDAYERVTRTTSTLNNALYVNEVAYDGNYGRMKSKKYPNGLTVAFEYNDYGYLQTEKNAGSGYVYRRINAMDAWGNISRAGLSHGMLVGDYMHAAETGQMEASIVAKDGARKHYYDYQYMDEFGNLYSQENMLGGAREVFEYDNLHRLTSNTLTDKNGAVSTVEYDYDLSGNLTRKSDFASVYYYNQTGNAGANAVSAVKLNNGNTYNFTYDLAGNMTKGYSKTVTYSSFNKPKTVRTGNYKSWFYYGSDMMRYRQVKKINDVVSSTIYYIDKGFEVEFKGSVTRETVYVGDVAVITFDSSKGDDIRFTHRDRLGSAASFTDHNGMLVGARGYDPFGRPRVAGGENLVPMTLAAVDSASGNDTSQYRRGFTDHEHIDESKVIHMNGRIYDYQLGRFMSVDPFIQSPGNTQSVNPYSYIMNNPLAGTDPSGYTSEDLSNIKTEDVENVQVTDEGKMVINKTDGSSYTVDKVNGKSVTSAMVNKGVQEFKASMNNGGNGSGQGGKSMSETDSQSTEDSQGHQQVALSGSNNRFVNQGRMVNRDPSADGEYDTLPNGNPLIVEIDPKTGELIPASQEPEGLVKVMLNGKELRVTPERAAQIAARGSNEALESCTYYIHCMNGVKGIIDAAQGDKGKVQVGKIPNTKKVIEKVPALKGILPKDGKIKVDHPFVHYVKNVGAAAVCTELVLESCS